MFGVIERAFRCCIITNVLLIVDVCSVENCTTCAPAFDWWCEVFGTAVRTEAPADSLHLCTLVWITPPATFITEVVMLYCNAIAKGLRCFLIINILYLEVSVKVTVKVAVRI